MRKRIISLALGLCLMCAMFSVTVFAAGNGSSGYQVCFDGYKGDDFGGIFEVNGSIETRIFRQENCPTGAKLKSVLNFSVTEDPQWGDLTFEGWLKYEEEGIEQHGPYHLQDETLYTTEQVMEHTVPSYNVRYVAKWAQIPMPYYESIYRPYFVIGEEGGNIEGFGSITADGHVVGITDSDQITAEEESEATEWTEAVISRCTVLFDGSTDMPVLDQMVPVGEKIPSPGVPVREGYEFAGWYKDASLTQEWDFDNDVVEEDMRLYAKWIQAEPEDEKVIVETTPPEEKQQRIWWFAALVPIIVIYVVIRKAKKKQ